MFLGRETWALSICENLNIRFYVPEVGRFGQVDPVTETQENYSLYQYGWGNPVLRSDPNGDCPLCPAIPLLPEIATGIATAFKVVAGSTFVVAVGVRLKELTSAGNLGGGGYSPSLGMAMSTTSPGEITSMMKSSSKSNNSVSSSTSSSGGNQKGNKSKTDEATGTRHKNRIPNKNEPNSSKSNESGTTTKKYGPDGKVQKEFNKGHQGDKVPKNEKKDHVHDYKPNPNNPSGSGEKRYPGRPAKKGELIKDFKINN